MTDQSLRELLVSYKFPVVVLPLYFLAMFLLHTWMKKRQPIELKTVLTLHNLFLCLLSLIMAVGTSFPIFQRWQRSGRSWYDIYCPQDLGDREGESLLWWFCWIFYLSKYYELLDTLFLILKKKPLSFLHVYHHSTIVVLCFFMIRYQMIFYFSGVIINATIHTFMYFYYFVSIAFDSSPWWKKYLTQAQIVQFIWGITSWWLYPFVCHPREDGNSLLPPPGGYSVDMYVWWYNQFILICFLGLFIHFFSRTYSKKSSKKDL